MSTAKGAVLVDKGDGNFIVQRKYNLEKDKKTGWWRWTCKGSSKTGTSATKKGARQAGRENCAGAFNLESVDLIEAVMTFELNAELNVELIEP